MSVPRLLFDKIIADIESRDLPQEKAAWELVSPNWRVTVSYSPELCMCANCVRWNLGLEPVALVDDGLAKSMEEHLARCAVFSNNKDAD